MKKLTMRDLQQSERPRERLAKIGPDKVSSVELIAIILGSGIKGMNVLELSCDLLCRFGSIQKLAEATIEELCQVKGMGNAKAIQLKAALTLGKRMHKETLEEGRKISCAFEAYLCVKEDLENEEREVVLALLLNAKGKVIRKEIISIGSLHESVVHPREVFYPAIRYKATSVILAHNHPSGDPTPSKEDLKVTKTLITVGDVMGIPLHDHIIVGKGKYTSLCKE